FSSRGPTNDSKYASPRIKPDIMGPDGVSTSPSGTFYGTSASSPHVAGAAALLLSENSGRTAKDLETILQADAVDMGISGKDNIYGAGRLTMNVDTQPPSLILDMTASENESQGSTLSWTNPSENDLARVVAQRKTGGYPVDHQDGITVYENDSPEPGELKTFTDSGLTNGTKYYYAVFTSDDAANWNESVKENSNADTAIPSYLGLSPTWNIVSPPGVPVHQDPGSALKDDVDPLTLYYDYLPGSGYTVYPTDTTGTKLSWRQGYWLKVTEYSQIDIGTNPPRGEAKLKFNDEGWHLIGFPYPVDWSKVEFSDPRDFANDQSRVRIISWSPGENIYYSHYSDKTYVLSPWRGYWVNVKSASQSNPAVLYFSETTKSTSPANAGNPLSVSKDTFSRASPPMPPEVEPKNDSYEVDAFPGLLRKGNSIRFEIRGSSSEVKGLKVSIFVPGGKVIWRGESQDSALTWNAEGAPNGVYIYSSSIKINGEWKNLDANKLLILR
ncbi:MAG: S8 family serine peptidase, partial [Candidatus Bipolaricaulia bacterium]